MHGVSTVLFSPHVCLVPGLDDHKNRQRRKQGKTKDHKLTGGKGDTANFDGIDQQIFLWNELHVGAK